MYAVVGCSDCNALWVVEGRPETTGCPRCGTRHQFDRLKRFVRTEDEDAAREVRTAMLADRQGEREAFEGLDSYAEMEAALEAVGADDETYLAANGVDPADVAAAAERAGSGNPNSRSREQVVRDALEDLNRPDEAAVVEYAEEAGVPPEWTRTALEKLVRAGEVTEGSAGYRLL